MPRRTSSAMLSSGPRVKHILASAAMNLRVTCWLQPQVCFDRRLATDQNGRQVTDTATAVGLAMTVGLATAAGLAKVAGLASAAG